MMAIPFERFRRLTFEECAWRGGEMARTTTDRLRMMVRAPRWDRGALPAALASRHVTAELAKAIARNDWHAAHGLLADAMRQRPRRFVVDTAAECV